jgi:hypothetical protein
MWPSLQAPLRNLSQSKFSVFFLLVVLFFFGLDACVESGTSLQEVKPEFKVYSFSFLVVSAAISPVRKK